jgi:hypothetical protein
VDQHGECFGEGLGGRLRCWEPAWMENFEKAGMKRDINYERGVYVGFAYVT